MFTGIIESLGVVNEIVKEGGNYHFTFASSISDELKIDQSISHNGTCLTVVEQAPGKHTVTAIEETINKTNLGKLELGTVVNLERAMLANARIDGHWVQGHVDGTGTCLAIKEVGGSWYFTFQYQPSPEHMLVDKGSICINGVSLTVVDPVEDHFSVAIIPYTFENTVFSKLKIGDTVNLEFDIFGKYIAKYMKVYMK